MNNNKFMIHFKSIITTVFIALVVSLSVAFTATSIEDVYKYADEALAVELTTRDGNFDEARCYKVTKNEDGSSVLEFAARDLDDFAVKAYYDKDGSYLYTEKDVSDYVARDVLGGICLAVFLSGVSYILYYILVDIAEAVIKLIKKIKEKKAAKKEALDDEESEEKEVSIDWNSPYEKK